jgi:hypothetical protein
MTASVKTALAFVLGLIAALLALTVLSFGATAHPAKAPHGNAYPKNFYPAGYYNQAEPGGDNYLGPGHINWQIRSYSSYKKVKVNGSFYYKLNARFFWYDGSEDYEVRKPVYAALHKLEDYGSKRPGFRVYMTHRGTGKHYWRRFEAAGSKPPNTVIVSGPRYKKAGKITLVYFRMWSPDPEARFQFKATTPATLPQTWADGRGKNGKTAELIITNPEEVVGHGMKAQAIDPAGHADPTPTGASFPPGPEYL